MKRLIEKSILLLGFIPLVWVFLYRGVLINGSDTNFPLDITGWFIKRFYAWSNINAGADFSASSAGLFFHLIQLIPHLLGLNLYQVQAFSLIFWFMLIVSSAFLLSHILFPKQTLAQFLFVNFYAINTYLFNTWENVKVTNLSLVSALPLGLSLLILLSQKRISTPKSVLFSCLIGIVLSGTGINPAYLSIFILTVFFFSLCSALKNRSLTPLKQLVVILVPIILINAFWIVPSANYIIKNIGPFGSIDKIGYANWIDSLSKDTSLLNIFRVQGAWDWYSFDSVSGLPTYIPYALNYFFRFPFILFSLLVPGLGILSLILLDKSRRELYLFFSLLTLVGIFMGAGTHLPSGWIFRWLLLNKVPFFSLFRSPWYIFTPVVTLAYAGFIGLLIVSLRQFKKSILFVNVAGFILFVGNLIYCYPLLTGKIYRPAQPDNFLIKFPSYVFSAQKWLASAETPEFGRFISFPPDEIERFKWGYNGIDSILGLISSVPSLFSPLNAPESPLSRILQEYYLSLSQGQLLKAKSLAAKLNANYVFYKQDQNTLSIELPEVIKKAPATDFGEWHFYRFLEKNESRPKIYPAAHLAQSKYPDTFAQTLATIPVDTALINSDDTQAEKIPNLDNYSSEVVPAINSQRQEMSDFFEAPHILANRIIDRPLNSVFSLEIDNEGSYTPILDRYRLETFGLQPSGKWAIDLDSQKTTWEVDKLDDSFVYFKPVSLSKGRHTIKMDIKNKNLIENGNFESPPIYQKIGISEFEIKDDGSNHYLIITNPKYSAPEPSARFKIADLDSTLNYLIKIKYRQVYGNIAQISVSQIKNNITYKGIAEGLPSSSELKSYSFFFEPVKTASDLYIDLVAPFISSVFGTQIIYDDIEIYPVFANQLIFIKAEDTAISSPQVQFTQVSPTIFTGTVTVNEGPHLLLFSENYNQDWVLDIKGAKKSSKLPIHLSANYYANAWYIDNPNSNYEFRIYYFPQLLKNIGFIISGLTLVSSIIIFAYASQKNSKTT